MVKKSLVSAISFLLFLPLFLCSCDNELLEPKGNRRLKRIIDMNGFVKEEWTYNKKGQIESIKSFIRTPFNYYTEDEDSDGLEEIKEGILNDHPRLLTYKYENNKMTEVVAVRKATQCGCGSSGSTSVYQISYHDDKINQINTKTDYGYDIYENVSELSYSPDHIIINNAGEDRKYILFYNEQKTNIIKKEEYFQGALTNLQYYTHDEKVNPFYQKLRENTIHDLDYWNKNNILTRREATHYSGIMYHYYGDYPLSSRFYSPFIDLEEWNFFYEYE